MAILPLRIPSSRLLKSLLSVNFKGSKRSRIGMTNSLQIMVDRAMVSTMTIPVAADIPPRNTSKVKTGCS